MDAHEAAVIAARQAYTAEADAAWAAYERAVAGLGPAARQDAAAVREAAIGLARREYQATLVATWARRDGRAVAAA